ncbi:MAG: UDP-3-O-(3-hydroxymyristoyl)glucosamine N-acyltransferase [Tannerella sp.]|jgi:UDP-3-O-[3-hydroxymyristoyl] glucosamine N-acyltransferase|nr:UDP-3-O-(3-hydroxymyristoyl)glucosamine N-acyltransferase [Tannerella sp.]
MEFSAQQIASFLNGTIAGNPEVKVDRFSKIEEGCAGSLTFLANPKYESYIYHTQASIVLVNSDFVPSAVIRATLVKVPNAYAALAMLMNLVEQAKPKKTGIAPTACIAVSATVDAASYVGPMACIGEQSVIGKGCLIYPHVCIGDRVTVGEGTIIYPHVTVGDDTVIGRNCILQAGAVIGSDGFGFAPKGDTYLKIPQTGNVVLEDDVEIGANTAIDRAAMGSTLIRRGVKLDNLIQIAHNVEIGEDTVMAAQTGIAGSTKVGGHCMFGGQVGLAGHIRIADHVHIGAQSGAFRDIAEAGSVIGSPVVPVRNFFRSSVLFNRLPELYRTLNRLEKEVEELRKNNHKQNYQNAETENACG